MSLVNQDEEHLRLLSILHYVWGGLAALGCCLGGVYSLVGGGMLAAANQGQNAPPAWFGSMFMVIGLGIMFLAAAVSAVTIFAGRCLAQRRNHTFCMVVAVISCLSVPLGTALGVFTIVVLQRPSVKELFQRTARSA